ncbi:unnamed protein product, partial [Prunus brigantina]
LNSLSSLSRYPQSAKPSLVVTPVTVTLSSFSPSAYLFFVDFFFVLHICRHLFPNRKREP